MPKYRTKSKIIEVVQFTGENIPGIEICQNRVYNVLDRWYYQVRIGDYIRIDNLNDCYPISKEELDKMYELIEEDG